MIKGEDNSQSCASWACGPSVAAGLMLVVATVRLVGLVRRTRR